MQSKMDKAHFKIIRRNLKQTLKSQNLKPAQTTRGRIYLKTETSIAKALTKVFGIYSVSPAKKTTSELKILIKVALRRDK